MARRSALCHLSITYLIYLPQLECPEVRDRYGFQRISSGGLSGLLMPQFTGGIGEGTGGNDAATTSQSWSGAGLPGVVP